MAGVRRFILFILGVICLLGALVEDPIHVTSLAVGLLLMGVITWDQIATGFGRDRRRDEPGGDRPATD